LPGSADPGFQVPWIRPFQDPSPGLDPKHEFRLHSFFSSSMNWPGRSVPQNPPRDIAVSLHVSKRRVDDPVALFLSISVIGKINAKKQSLPKLLHTDAYSATVTLELEKRLALEKRIRQELAKIEHALDKFAKGTYGLCDICGQPIDPARLEALPEANLCLSCKAKGVRNRLPAA